MDDEAPVVANVVGPTSSGASTDLEAASAWWLSFTLPVGSLHEEILPQVVQESSPLPAQCKGITNAIRNMQDAEGEPKRDHGSGKKVVLKS